MYGFNPFYNNEYLCSTIMNKIVIDSHMYDHYPDAVVFSKDGIITYVNEAVLKLIHMNDKDKVLGKEIIHFVHPSQKKEASRRINTMLVENEPLVFKDLIIEVGDLIEGRSQIITEAVSFPIYDTTTGHRYLLSIVRDTTEQKRSEELLLQSEKLSVIGQLAAGVAHEIRNPLAALKGFTQLLRSKLPDYSGYLNIMISEIDRINLIVNEFMTLAKPQYSELRAGRLESIIESVKSILETQAILYNVEIVLELAPSLPYVLCNENQLKQVFLNILKNGIEAMPNGGLLRISASACPNKITVTIQDNGVGIPDDLIGRIGEPFITTKEKGTGLGLMISSRIIEEHNGKLTLNSQLDVGTTVTITLPAYSQ